MTSMRTVVILGGTVAGWMAAAMLTRRLPRALYRVVLVETQDNNDGSGLGDFGTALTALPSLAPFNAEIGIGEARLLRHARGSIALGSARSGWAGAEITHFLPFGRIGAPLGPVAFHQMVTRLRLAGRSVRIADYALAAIAAQAGRFGTVGLAYGLHLDGAGYRSVLRDAATALGVRTVPAPFRAARSDAHGAIAALDLADGTAVAGMLFVDASGAQALLARRTLDIPFESWRAWLPCDRMRCQYQEVTDVPPLLYAHVEAMPGGWRTTLPLDGAEARLTCWSSTADARDDGDVSAFENGRLTAPWHSNCVAIGTAACMLEPLYPFALDLVRRALERLIALFPAGPDSAVEAREYNRMTTNELDRARDVVIACQATTSGPPIRDHGAPLPEPLAYKLAQFASAGRMPMYDDEPIDAEDWIALLDAQGLHPRRHDALAGTISLDQIDRHLATLRRDALAAVKTLSPYRRALAA